MADNIADTVSSVPRNVRRYIASIIDGTRATGPSVEMRSNDEPLPAETQRPAWVDAIDSAGQSLNHALAQEPSRDSELDAATDEGLHKKAKEISDSIPNGHINQSPVGSPGPGMGQNDMVAFGLQKIQDELNSSGDAAQSRRDGEALDSGLSGAARKIIGDPNAEDAIDKGLSAKMKAILAMVRKPAHSGKGSVRSSSSGSGKALLTDSLPPSSADGQPSLSASPDEDWKQYRTGLSVPKPVADYARRSRGTDDEFTKSQDASGRNMELATMARQLAEAGGRISKQKVDMEPYDNAIKQAGRPTERIKERKAFDASESKRELDDSKAHQELDSMDPRSRVSNIVVQMAKKMVPDAEVDGMSAADIARAYPMMKEFMESTAQAAIKEADRISREATKDKDREASKERADLANAIRQQGNALMYAARMSSIAAGDRRADRTEENQDKRQGLKEKERIVPGWKFQQGVIPSPKAAESFRSLDSGTEQVMAGLDDLVHEYDTNGHQWMIGSEENGAAKAARVNLMYMGKLFPLGVLQESDLRRMEEAWPDPTKIAPHVFEKQFKARIRELKGIIGRARSIQAYKSGYEPERGESSAQPPSSQGAPVNGAASKLKPGIYKAKDGSKVRVNTDGTKEPYNG